MKAKYWLEARLQSSIEYFAYYPNHFQSLEFYDTFLNELIILVVDVVWNIFIIKVPVFIIVAPAWSWHEWNEWAFLHS